MGDNSATRAYLAVAKADFKEHTFPGDADFARFQFPGLATFEGAAFGNMESSRGDAVFEGAQFSGGAARFDGALFRGGDARFAGAQFSGGSAQFLDVVFSGGAAWFLEAEFSGGVAGFARAQFSGGVALFEGARFSGGAAGFTGARFSGGNAEFHGARFSGGDAWFDGAEFSGGAAMFQGAQFSGGDASFQRAKFSGDEASFAGALFTGGVARFIDASFVRRAYFGRVRLSADDELYKQGQVVTFKHDVDFTQAVFEDAVTFEGARFEKGAVFRVKEARAAVDFAGVHFAQAPDFISVALKEAPRLDNVTIAAPLARRDLGDKDPRGKSGWRCFALALDGSEHARYRKLRKMAGEAKDHENEIRFNAHEIASRRFWVDRPWPPSAGAGRFWISWLYAKLSNYGQSLGRPLVAWAVLLMFFACLYLFVPGAPAEAQAERPAASAPAAPASKAAPAPKPASGGQTWLAPLEWAGGLLPAAACHSDYEAATRDKDTRRQLQPTGRIWEALVLSFRNALIFDRSDVSRRMYGCLYGIQDKDGQDYPFIPPLVTALSTLQSFLAAILIFLAGLALRNMYRVK